jgi:CRP/FNR family cyclic AMP-dependent transcriptional regulator
MIAPTSDVKVADPVALAVQRSVLASLPSAVLDSLLRDAMRIDVPAGGVLYRKGDPPRCGLLVNGHARVFIVAGDGRQVTIRYMPPGSLSGSSVVIRGTPADVRVQAVTDLVGLLLNVATLRSLAESDASMAFAPATEIANSQDDIMRSFRTSMFGSLQQRLVRHLLDLAAAQFVVGRTLVAPVTQQELADAIGSSREAVTRGLRELRDAGLVQTTRGGVVLLEAARLHATVEPRDAL